MALPPWPPEAIIVESPAARPAFTCVLLLWIERAMMHFFDMPATLGNGAIFRQRLADFKVEHRARRNLPVLR